jgi:uncharacterized membrane protein
LKDAKISKQRYEEYINILLTNQHVYDLFLNKSLLQRVGFNKIDAAAFAKSTRRSWGIYSINY